MKTMPFNLDALSNGQVSSKLWLTEQLEKHIDKPVCAWLFGGWYALLPFIILTRGKIKFSELVNFDIDPNVEDISRKMLDNWKFGTAKFDYKFFNLDVNELNSESLQHLQLNPADLIINSSVEHIASQKWWDHIPENTMVALQSCDMKHEEHINLHQTLEEFSSQYPMKKQLFCDQLYFDYQNENSFNRFMKIGFK